MGYVAARAAAEKNELDGWWSDRMARIGGGRRFPSNTLAARAMDRHTNRIGSVIGAVARTPTEVAERARLVVEHARRWGGSGHNGTAAWLERRVWEDPPRDQTGWPSIQWPDLAQSKHLHA